LLDALAARRRLPFVRRDDGLTVLHSADERPYVIDVRSETPDRRRRLLHEDGIDRALIALSSPIGIEGLPEAAAAPLIQAHLDGVLALGEGFAAWGPIAVDQLDPDQVDRLLARGCLGVSVPAGALAGDAALARIGPTLDRVAGRGVPLLVHPGPAAGHTAGEASLTEPLWWRALTDYVAQMQAAWLTFSALGRREHPRLIIVFAMLGGLAPLQNERLATRGGPSIDLGDRNVFYDTSSYGDGAIDAMARCVGVEQLVYGSDRPVVEPLPGRRDGALRANGAALLAAAGRLA
jgi:hypothetical protein